jgi:hypothetical protein
MADLVITASEVVQSTNGGDISHGKSGEAIAVGEPVYLNSTDQKIYRADANTSAATAASKGIATSSSDAADQSVSYQRQGTLTLGASASVLQGQTYVVSRNTGKIALEGDLITGDYVTSLGVGNASNGLVMPPNGPVASGVAHV